MPADLPQAYNNPFGVVEKGRVPETQRVQFLGRGGPLPRSSLNAIRYIRSSCRDMPQYGLFLLEPRVKEA